MTATAPVLRFRRSAAISVAATIAVIGAVPATAVSPWFAVLLLVPLAVAIWGWRSGTDVTSDGLVLRAALGSRRLAWTDVSELAVAPEDHVAVRLNSGGVLQLPAVPAKALPQIVELAGTHQ